MVDPLESETSADGRRDLGGYIGRDLSPREVTQAGESDGERGVQVCTGDVTSGENHDHHSKSGACCISDEGFRSVVLLVHNWPRGCSKHQDEGSHELSSNLAGEGDIGSRDIGEARVRLTPRGSIHRQALASRH